MNVIEKLSRDKKKRLIIFSQSISALLTIIGGKLIAEYIEPEDFGYYNLQFATFSFFFAFFVGPVINHLKSSYYNVLPKFGYRPFFKSFLLFGSLALLFIITFLAFYQNGKLFDYKVLIILILFLPFNVIYKTLSDQFNVVDEIKQYSSLTIIKATAGIVLLIFFFFLLKDKIESSIILWLYQLCMVVVPVVIFFPKMKKYASNRIISTYVFIKRFQLKFIGPLMFLSIWSWVNNYFDKYVLENHLGFNDVGIYTANSSLGSKAFLMLIPVFTVAITPFIYRNNSVEAKKQQIKRYALIYLIIGLLILTVIYFTKNFIGGLLLSQKYSNGFYLIFWFALAYMFRTLTNIYETVFYAEKNTKIMLYSNLLSALSNIVFNLILIPIYGLNGAVFSLVFSALVYYFYTLYKYYKI